MKKVFWLFVLFFGLCFATHAQDIKNFAGVWKGTIENNNSKITLIFSILEDNGKLTGTVESPERGSKPVALDNIKVTGNKIRFNIHADGGSYDGNINNDKNSIDGLITLNSGNYPLVINKTDAPLPEVKKETPLIKSFWEGALNVNTIKLRLIIKAYIKDDGTMEGVLLSPDQSTQEMPLSSISVTDDSLKFAIAKKGLTYSGKLDKSKMTAKGTFKQNGMAFQVEFKKSDKEPVTELKRPQTPKKPYPYNEEEITFENKLSNITLAGTLTFPKSGSTFTVVILVPGSGAHDRDETVLGHKPFLVIADYLTRNGIAVFRYDDRGIGKSKGTMKGVTTEILSTDVLAAVEYLKTRKEFTKIGIMGHSEGGDIAPMCADKSKDVSFIVLLGGPGVSGKEILMRQIELIARASGANEQAIKISLATEKKLLDVLTSVKDSVEMDKQVRGIMYGYDPAKQDKPSVKNSALENSIMQVEDPWFRYFVKYDPRPVLSKIKIPVLALTGSKDLQVEAKQNLPEIEKALKKAGNKNYKLVTMPGLNHLFQTAKTGAPSEYSDIEETFSIDALKIISNWIFSLK